MNKKLMLFPFKCRQIGWWTLIPSFLLGTIILIWNNDISYIGNFINSFGTALNDIAIIGNIVGAILVSCSKLKQEDEMISHIRLNSLLLALYINSILVIIATLMLNFSSFLYVMACNLCTLPLAFVIIFEISIYKLNQTIRDEK